MKRRQLGIAALAISMLVGIAGLGHRAMAADDPAYVYMYTNSTGWRWWPFSSYYHVEGWGQLPSGARLGTVNGEYTTDGTKWISVQNTNVGVVRDYTGTVIPWKFSFMFDANSSSTKKLRVRWFYYDKNNRAIMVPPQNSEFTAN